MLRAVVFSDDASSIAALRRALNLCWPEDCQVMALPSSAADYRDGLAEADFVFVDGDSLGGEAVKSIRSATSCPIIGLATLDEANVTVPWLLGQGVDDYLYKPFSSLDVLKRLANLTTPCDGAGKELPKGG